MSAAELYAAMVAYVEANGWQRIEDGSGWWYGELGEETIGGAVEEQFHMDGIDTREEPA